MSRSTSTLRVLLPSLLAAVFVAAAAHAAAPAQDEDEPPERYEPVYVKPPDGYLPAPFPEKRVGNLLLNAKRPAGMYVAYPKTRESAEEFTAVLKTMVASMFIRDPKTPITWTVSALPPHRGVPDDAGTLFVASDGRTEIQLAAYTRTLGRTKVAYGYYAMRHRGAPRADDGVFLDDSGNGVKEFDKFWQSIRSSREE